VGTSAPADFVEWYQREHPRLLGALTAMSGDLDAAADATDEAFVRALARWHRVGTMRAPSAWTYRVALNVLRRRMRRRRMERDRVARWLVAPDAAPTSRPEVWVAVGSLPDRQRLAVVLRYIGDLPERDVADVMGVSRGTVASTLSDARSSLARSLGNATNELEVPHE
jgi:RNA polymerase sigma factor (sigma-70 family)